MSSYLWLKFICWATWLLFQGDNMFTSNDNNFSINASFGNQSRIKILHKVRENTYFQLSFLQLSRRATQSSINSIEPVVNTSAEKQTRPESGLLLVQHMSSDPKKMASLLVVWYMVIKQQHISCFATDDCILLIAGPLRLYLQRQKHIAK